MKKIWIILISSFAFVALVLGVYFAWQKSQEILNPPAAETGELPGTTFRLTGSEGENGSTTDGNIPGRVTAVSDQPVFDYWVLTNNLQLTTNPPSSGFGRAGNGQPATNTVSSTRSSSTVKSKPTLGRVFYMNEKGQILEVKEGNDELISSGEISNIQKMVSSPDGKMVLVRSGDRAIPLLRIFNAETRVWQEIPKGVAGAFSPDGKKLVYFARKDGGALYDLVVKDLGSQRQENQTIFTFLGKDFELLWPLSQKILFVPKTSASLRGQAWVFDLKQKIVKPFSEGMGLMINWSANDSAGFRYRIIEDRVQELSLVSEAGSLTAKIGLNTLSSKCFFPGKVIYCAVPSGYNSMLPPNLPDDYLKRAVYSDDVLYKLDMDSNTMDIVALISDMVFDMEHIISLGDRILFINRYDGNVYEVRIAQ